MLSANSCIRLQFAYGVSNTIFSLVSGGQYLVQVEELFILSFYINFKLQKLRFLQKYNRQSHYY
jgi:hypothetical protein